MEIGIRIPHTGGLATPELVAEWCRFAEQAGFDLLWGIDHVVMPEHAEVVTAPGVIPPNPRLQPHPQQDIALERAQKQQMLSGYRWLDGSHDFARIPIERAMQLYVQQHGGQAGPAAPSSSPEVQP